MSDGHMTIGRHHMLADYTVTVKAGGTTFAKALESAVRQAQRQLDALGAPRDETQRTTP